MREGLDRAELQLAPTTPPRCDLVLRSRPVWMAVAFAAMLAGAHYTHAISSLIAGRSAGYLSLVIGSILLLAGVAIFFFRYEVAFLAMPRTIRIRHGFRRFHFERRLRFDDVRAVRLTFEQGASERDHRVELLCPLEDIACPPTPIPRQEALYLAMLMEVTLIKLMVHADGEFLGARMTYDRSEASGRRTRE